MKVAVRRYWHMFSTYLSAQRGRFILLTLLLFGSIGLQLGIPQITRYFIDTAREGAPQGALLVAAAAFLFVSLLQQAVTVLARYVGEVVAWTATNEMRIDLARHCLRLDMSFHNDKRPGELIERIDGDILAISNFFSQLVILIVGNLFLLLGILIVLCTVDIRVGLVFSGFAAITLSAFIMLRNIAVPYDKANREALSDMFGYLEERLAGTEDIRASGAVGFVLRGLYRLHRVIYETWKKAELMHVVIRLVAGVMLTLGFGIAFVAGHSLYGEGLLTIGTVYMIVHYTNMIARPIRIITRQMQNLQNIGANVERINEIFAIENKLESTAELEAIRDREGPDVAEGPLSLAFENVHFGYVENEPVLSDLCFRLEAGKVLGILGRTGSGKTTLARLVLRLYDPDSGTVLLGDREVKSYGLDDLRDTVAMVTQDVQLFQASVRDNLTFFDPSVPDEKLEEVIEVLGLADWFAALPDGLDSRLQTGGKGLSAGEAQLLAFTRIFLRDPRLVILDEASSRLDPATEVLIEKVVDRLLKGRTAVIIAHRLATVNRTDEILILGDGRVIEKGGRRTLAGDTSSTFYRLLQTGLEEVLA